ncbi:MAG: sugar phosphate isomerase/epimerase [Bacteroidetes bacterium]|nr:sugar phosphate isomerase/epimerase [Bacteroidota bacterium]
MHDLSKEKIRIGTLVNGGEGVAKYITQILPRGFESFSITFWKTTREVEWQKMADEVLSVLEGSGAVISSLSVFGNPMETEEADLETLKSWEEIIDNAHLFGCDIVSGFTGRLRGRRIDESIDRYREVWSPLAEKAAAGNVRIAFENCDMGGTWQSGDWNIAHNPTAWQLMFDAIDTDSIGLEWEPCHQMVSLIDPMPQLREWVPKIFHVHGKDATIHWDVVRKYGIHASVPDDIALPGKVQIAPPFVFHRTPGFGDSNWTDIISDLRIGGFEGSIDIEGWHDPIYRNELEMTGQVHALNYLKTCRGGFFVENPQS